jgi:drug/metabolite transporter (DMT)-like permease
VASITTRRGDDVARAAQTSPAPTQAILLVCLAGLLFVGMNSLTKALLARFDPLMLIWARYFFHVLLILALFPRRFWGFLRTSQPGVQLGRSVLVLLATVANFLALAWLPLGEVAAITFTTPILVAALAVPILRERVSPIRWLAILTGFTGALLVVRPGLGPISPGSLLAFGCAAAYALYQISTRIVREAEPMVSLLYGGLVGMVALTLAVPFAWRTPVGTEWLLLAAIGVLGALAHLLLILALQRGEASRVSPFSYLQLLWAMLASFLVFGDLPGPATLAGAALVAGSGLWIYRLGAREAAGAARDGADPARPASTAPPTISTAAARRPRPGSPCPIRRRRTAPRRGAR